MAATLTGALAATAEPRKVEVMAAILYKCVVDAISRMIGATRRARHKTNGDSELDRPMAAQDFRSVATYAIFG